MSPSKKAAIEKWLDLISDAPLECDGMTRSLSTVLSHHSIRHDVHIGSLEVNGHGEIPVHFWIVLGSGDYIDLRAHMWLGDNPEVPHGMFVPSKKQHYHTMSRKDPRQVALPPGLFSLLTGHQLGDFGPPQIADQEAQLA